MAATLLPTTPGYQKSQPHFLDYGVTLSPALGGVAQRLDRLGSRFALDVTIGGIKEGATWRLWAAAMMAGRSAGVAYPWPQPGLVIGTPGAALIDGAGQSGSTLNLKSMTPGYTIAALQAFSIADSGRRYLYLASAAATVLGTGKVALPIFPMLRSSPADATACEFAAPLIEGLLSGAGVNWEHDVDNYVPFSFGISEVA